MRLNPVLERLTPYRAGPPLEDIRRRLSDPSRPQEELQYLERLLEQ